MQKFKGAFLYSFAIGIVLTIIGVTFMYLLPSYIISALNQTGVFCSTNTTPAQCAAALSSCCGDYSQLGPVVAKVGQVQAVGFAVIILGLIFMLVGVVGGLGKK